MRASVAYYSEKENIGGEAILDRAPICGVASKTSVDNSAQPGPSKAGSLIAARRRALSDNCGFSPSGQSASGLFDGGGGTGRSMIVSLKTLTQPRP
jgi:hypothetical protein